MYNVGDVTYLISEEEMISTFHQLYPNANNEDFLRQMIPHAGKMFTIAAIEELESYPGYHYRSMERYEVIDTYTCFIISEKFLIADNQTDNVEIDDNSMNLLFG